MSEHPFNPAQLEAIETRGVNLLVAAGAGSGKTTVLVNRIIRRLEQGGGADRLLVLTFTHAAADDMRAKIDAALSSRVLAQPENRHLQRQLSLLPQAQISTVHAFCLSLLKRYYYFLDLPAGFRVASEMEGSLLLREVLDDFLEAEYAGPQSPLPRLADAYGGAKDDGGLIALMLSLYRYSLSRPEPVAWLRQVAAVFGQGRRLEDYPFAVYAGQALALKIALAARPFAEARALTFRALLPPLWQELINRDLAQLNRVREADTLSAQLEALRQVSFERLPAGKKQLRQGLPPGAEPDEAALERFRDLRRQGREAAKDLAARFTGCDNARLLADLQAVGPLMTELVELIGRFHQALSGEKLRRGLIDYHDMEHLARRLLAETEVAAELRERFDEVLVDEYQDINEVQEGLFRALSRGDNFFAVGDVKQSIYRFRLAEPRLFLDKYQAYGQGRGGRRIDLNENYRSDIRVVQGVNFLFGQLMYPEVAELDYDSEAELKAGRDVLGAPPELHLLDLAVGEEEEEALTSLQGEARLIARRLKELAAEGYGYRDMAILLRSLKSNQELLAAELRQAGIPVLTADSGSGEESPERDLLLSLLAVIDNPRQDIPLAAVLRSPLFGFSDDQLAAIRLDHREGDFYTALAAAAAAGDSLGQEARSFLRLLEKWRYLAGMERVDRLLLAIYQDTGAERLFAALENGGRRLLGLRQLYNEAHQYDESGYAGLFRFIRLLADSREQGFSRPALPEAGEADAVRILSIHKSKGLEFPVVVAAALNSHYNFQDEYADLIWERSLGLGARIVDTERRSKYPTLSHVAVAQKMRDQALAEELRVLYVALTRARERLILTGASPRMSRVLLEQGRRLGGDVTGPKLPLYVTATAQKPLDWLIPALLRHQDGAALREAAGLSGLPLLRDGSRWQIRLWQRRELESGTEQAVCPVPPQVDDALRQQVRQALSFSYPGRELCDAPVKWTVSDLNRERLTPEAGAETAVLPVLADMEAPEAGAEGAATADSGFRQQAAARRGTLYHLLLQHLDPARSGPAELRELAQTLISQGLLSGEELASISVDHVAAFCRSPLGRRLAASTRLLREIPFTLALEPADPGGVIIQGMLDAAFREPDGWVLLDYKTGGRGKSDGELRSLYQGQLDYYALAIARLWRAPVKEKYLVMLDLGRSVAL